MLEIVVTVCLLAHAQTCQVERLPSAATSLVRCVSQAQPQIARWIEHHPEWLVKTYRCGVAGAEREA